MKKYLIASVVAMMAFAFAAFAASLIVNAGTLQAGEDRDLECLDEANVAAWGYDDTHATALVYVDIVTVGENCTNDEVMHLILLNSSGSQLARGNSANNPTKDYADLDGTARYRFDFSPSVDVQDVYGVRIGVDQGHTDYSY